MGKFFNIEISNTVTDTTGKTYKNLNDLLLARNRLSKLRGVDAAYKQAYNATTSLLETTIARSMGATKVKETSGKGAIFDFILYDEENNLTSAEAKLINVQTDGKRVTKASAITVSSSSIALRGGTSKSLITGINSSIDLSSMSVGTELPGREATTVTKVGITKPFVNRLLEAKGDQLALKKILNGKDEAAVALRRNFELKSSDIRILYNLGGVTKIASIGWTWRDIYRNNKATINIEAMPGNKGVFINVVFSEALVRDAINKANRRTMESITTEVNNSLLKALAKDFSYLSPNIKAIIDKVITTDITYDAGSLLVYNGSIKQKSSKKMAAASRTRQAFISNIQWTMLTQKRLGETMKRVGDPAPPDIKERSGRFRQSVQVIANYRSNLLSYTYNPLYRGLEHYGYHPELQVERAIRDVAQSIYNRHFSIIRQGAFA